MSDISIGQVGAPVSAGDPLNSIGIAAGSTEETAQQLYGYLAVYLNMPEVGDILKRAAAEHWGTDKLEAELGKTTWWQTTQQSAREFDAKWQTDRASVTAQIRQQADALQNDLRQQYGVTIDYSRLFEIARQGVRENWSDVQMKAAMDSELARKPDILQSKVGVDLHALRSQFGVELSDPVLQQWAAHLVSGVRSEDEFRQEMVRRAKSRFRDPSLGKWLDDGGTVAQFYDDYKQRAANRLGINPDTIDLSDPKWFAAFNGKDQNTGEIRAMTVDEWDKYIMNNPIYGYEKTADAQRGADALIGTFDNLYGGVKAV